MEKKIIYLFLLFGLASAQSTNWSIIDFTIVYPANSTTLSACNQLLQNQKIAVSTTFSDEYAIIETPSVSLTITK